jgi:hypothetical protein
MNYIRFNFLIVIEWLGLTMVKKDRKLDLI